MGALEQLAAMPDSTPMVDAKPCYEAARDEENAMICTDLAKCGLNVRSVSDAKPVPGLGELAARRICWWVRHCQMGVLRELLAQALIRKDLSDDILADLVDDYRHPDRQDGVWRFHADDRTTWEYQYQGAPQTLGELRRNLSNASRYQVALAIGYGASLRHIDVVRELATDVSQGETRSALIEGYARLAKREAMATMREIAEDPRDAIARAEAIHRLRRYAGPEMAPWFAKFLADDRGQVRFETKKALAKLAKSAGA